MTGTAPPAKERGRGGRCSTDRDGRVHDPHAIDRTRQSEAGRSSLSTAMKPRNSPNDAGRKRGQRRPQVTPTTPRLSGVQGIRREAIARMRQRLIATSATARRLRPRRPAAAVATRPDRELRPPTQRPDRDVRHAEREARGGAHGRDLADPRELDERIAIAASRDRGLATSRWRTTAWTASV